MSVEPVEDAPWASVLSPREIEVAVLVGRGLSNKEVALKLEVAEQTVKHRMHRILRKLGAPSRSKLILSMAQQGERE